MIRKILIANRGEIAVRIARACAEMSIRSAAVYADADRHGLHVKKADEAYSLGPDTVSGYLNAHRIVNLAVATGCDAIHPGYGFLSENPQLAEICVKRGVIFIGPDAQAIRRMGDKIEARRSMIKAKIPVVPGSDGNLASVDEAVAFARSIGYPVMLKATSGGGGRGIRRCDSEDDLKRNFNRVISEATKAFGSADVFVEKFVVNPRHIEVQILADHHGNVIHLFERDCSIQRRHQKLIEIAPSPQLNDEQRSLIGKLAVKAAKKVGYRNAGTVEFLLDESGEFFFMEMNTRLQVEHTVTEQITGIDIVQEQIRIADGQALRYKPEDLLTDADRAVYLDEAAALYSEVVADGPGVAGRFQKRRGAFHFRRASSANWRHVSSQKYPLVSHGVDDASSSIHCRARSECAWPVGPAHCLHHGPRNLEPEFACDGCALHRAGRSYS